MAGLTRNLFHGMRGGNERSFDLAIEGDWPDDVDGFVFQVGPDRQRPGDHWFAGQALLTRIACRPRDGRIRVDLRRVETPLDRIRRVSPSLFRRRGVLEVSPFGFSNFGNTNVQWLDDRLFLGYDAGRPLEVDPETLELLTPVGRNAEWLQTLPAASEPMIAVAAHPGPAYEEAALYFANYDMIPLSGERQVRVCRWDLEGAIEHWRLENVGAFDSIHDVKVTREWVVLLDLPFVNESMGPIEGAPRRALADTAQLFLVRKADLRAVSPGGVVPHREVRIPMMGGHLAVDHVDDDGRIVVTIAHHPMSDLGLGLEASDIGFRSGAAIAPDHVGLFPFVAQPIAFGRHVIDATNGSLIESRWTKELEPLWGGLLFDRNLFDRAARERPASLWTTSAGFDPELVPERWWRTYAEQHENVLVPPRDLPRDPLPGCVVHVDLRTMSLRGVHVLDAGTLAHPATFVPRAGGFSRAPGTDWQDDADGYVLALIHCDGDKRLALYDAGDVSSGPIATATAPGFNPPLGLHATFAPRREGPRPSAYAVDVELDAWETLQAFAANPGPSAGFGRAIYGR